MNLDELAEKIGGNAWTGGGRFRVYVPSRVIGNDRDKVFLECLDECGSLPMLAVRVADTGPGYRRRLRELVDSFLAWWLEACALVDPDWAATLTQQVTNSTDVYALVEG